MNCHLVALDSIFSHQFEQLGGGSNNSRFHVDITIRNIIPFNAIFSNNLVLFARLLLSKGQQKGNNNLYAQTTYWIVV